jgi:hypothetical protein
MLTSTTRNGLIALAAAAGLIVTVLIALPFVVRHVAIQRVAAMTGRAVTIGDVDLNLFTRRVVFTDVRIDAAGGAPPLATARRIEARFDLLPLARGRAELDRLVVVQPVVHVVRRDGGSLSVEDVVEHWSARPAGEPARATIEVLTVQDGRITFVDRAVEPAREWVLTGLAVEARAIGTVADAADGRLSATFDVAGGKGEVHLAKLRVRPLAGHARVELAGLDVAPFNSYLAAAPVGLAGGRFSTTVALEYDARGIVEAAGQGTLRDLALTRPTQEPPFITVPLATLRLHDLAWTDGALSVADVVLTAARATVFDATAARARPLEVRDVEAVFQDGPEPAAGTGRITLSAALPGNGTLQARGTGELFPPAGEISVEVHGLDAALAQVWIPPDAPFTPTGGQAGATLALRYAPDAGLRVGGRAWVTELAIARRGQPAPFLRDDRVEVTVTDFVAGDANVGFERLHLVASPTIVPGDTPTALPLQELTVTASGGRFRGSAPTQVEARIALPHGGTVTATGEARLTAATIALDVVATDVDAMLTVPYVLPPQAPVTFDTGRLDARLAVAWRAGLHVGGEATLRALTVRGRDREAPIVEHATLRVQLADFVLRDGALSLDRVTLTGSPTIVDVTASPPQRFEMHRMHFSATNVTWPGRAPMQVAGLAETADGGTAALKGSFDVATLAADVQVVFDGIDVTRARGYIPAAVPLVVDRGHASGTVRLRHTRADGVEIDGDGSVRDLALTLTVRPVAPITEDRVTFRVEDVVVKDGRVAVGTLAIDGSPQLAAGEGTAPPFGLRAELHALDWPDGAPADFAITAHPGPGVIDIRGTFAPATRTVEATIRAEDAALAPFAPLIPVDAPVAGRVDARLEATLRPGTEAPLAVRGDLTAHAVRIGPEETAPVTADALRVSELAIEGRTIDIARVVLETPSVLVERDEDGSFPLRAMLTPDGAGAAAPRETIGEARRIGAVRPAGGGAGPAPWRVGVDEIRITDGTVRLIDRTSRPFYSEEITRLEATVRDFSTVNERTAGLTIQGIVGADAALDLRGEMAPFAEPFFLEVSGTLRDFSVPRTNPLLQRFLDWVARRGELTTKVHYRIVGDELQATNELIVHRLDLERARDTERAERLVGMPLGLVVSLLKDASGTIRFTLPVSGELGSPTFSFGDAIKTALRNVLGRLITSPFRAIGSVFRHDGDGEVEEVRVNPVTFPAGSAALTPEAAGHLQRVADFLRASPYVRLGLAPAVSDNDLDALRAAEITAHIQRVQREEGMDDFATAARRVWQRRFPEGPAPPEDPKAIVPALAQREAPPTQAARELAERRLNVARTHLVEQAGISKDRLPSAPEPPRIGIKGEGRVDFSLLPAS